MNLNFLKLISVFIALISLCCVQINTEDSDGKTSFRPKRGFVKQVPKAITLKGILIIKADVGFLATPANITLTTEDNLIATTQSVYETNVSDAEIRALHGKKVELKGMGLSSSSAGKTKQKDKYCTITKIESIKEILPESKDMSIEGKLTKTDGTYIVTTKSKEVIKITLDSKTGITEEKLDKIIDRKVIVEGKGYKNNGHIFTSISTITETLLSIEGVLSKNEESYIVTTSSKEIIIINVDDKSNLNVKSLEKLLDKKVVVKGTGSIENFHPVFTAMVSIAEILPKK